MDKKTKVEVKRLLDFLENVLHEHRKVEPHDEWIGYPFIDVRLKLEELLKLNR